jgi:hypothetical protein
MIFVLTGTAQGSLMAAEVVTAAEAAPAFDSEVDSAAE